MLTYWTHEAALPYACEEGFSDVVKVFMRNGLVDAACQDSGGTTPLMYAVKAKDIKTVRRLFGRSQGEDVAASLAVAACDKEGRNALSWAASARDQRILELLLKHAPKEACRLDINGWGPLAWTLDPPRYIQNAQLLLPYCKEHLEDVDGTGNAILSTAINWSRPEIARLITETTSLDVNSKSQSGRTALSLAASKGLLDIVRLLIEMKDADPSIASDMGHLPLQYAQLAGYSSGVDYLKPITQAVPGAQRQS